MLFKERADRRAITDARIIMGEGTVTERLNRHWYEKNTGQPGNGVGIQCHPQRVRLPGLPRRTPFSSINSTPADSRAALSAASFAAVTGSSPSIVSTRRIVATPTFEALAKSRALHLSKARAARSWALEIPMSRLVCLI
jgi:hypothetical protein